MGLEYLRGRKGEAVKNCGEGAENGWGAKNDLKEGSTGAEKKGG